MLDRFKHLLLGTLRRQLTVGMAVLVAATMLLFVQDITRRAQVQLMDQQTLQARAPVSYTHLDVYKRQVLRLSSTRTTFSARG